MSNKSRIVFIFWLVITLIPVMGLVWSVISPGHFEYWQSFAREYFGLLGVVGPIIFVLVQAFQVVVTPVSHYTVGAIGGYLYGPYWGGILNYLGRIIGHCIAFAIARRFGRSWIIKHLPEETVRKYDTVFSGNPDKPQDTSFQPLILFLIYFLPLFPDDEISYLVGASRMRFRSFLLANLFGHLGGAFSLAYIGSGINTKDPLFWILTLSTLAGFPIIWFLWRLHAKRISMLEEQQQ